MKCALKDLATLPYSRIPFRFIQTTLCIPTPKSDTCTLPCLPYWTKVQ